VNFHGASVIGGAAVVNGEVFALGVNWAERFEDGMWQPVRDKDESRPSTSETHIESILSWLAARRARVNK
jgi:hypothetical protein